MSPQAVLDQAILLHQKGRLAEAEPLYRHVLTACPKNFRAQYLFASLCYQQQRAEEALRSVEAALNLNPDAPEGLSLHGTLLAAAGLPEKALLSFDHAVARKPDYAEAWYGRGVSLIKQKRYQQAVDSFDRALAIRAHAESWNNRGRALQSLDRFDEALRSFDEALALKPQLSGAWFGRGAVLIALNRMQDAVENFDALLKSEPQSAETWNMRGVALHGLNRFGEELESYDKALAIHPGYAEAWNNRGGALRGLKRFEDAIDSYVTAQRLDPDYADAWTNHAVTLQSLRRFAEAKECVSRALAIWPDDAAAAFAMGEILCESNQIAEGIAVFASRAARLYGSASAGMAAGSAHKQKHDAEQRHYLNTQGIQLRNSALYLADGERIATPAVNTANAPEASAQWQKNRPQIIVIDDLLTDAALEKLRRFCWESTVWQKVYSGGYLGATLENGFACPLLAQIAEEFRDTFPSIFCEHALCMLWGFKYDSNCNGINIHADQAAVNVNFWITPDEANNNPQSGGLVIWDAKAPLDWDSALYNNSDEAPARAFLAQVGAKKVTVPYRANRAVIFDSDLFHETDAIDFKEGYLNRRINITMLYGRRTPDGS